MSEAKANKIYAIIPAAGKGKRMRSDKLKVMRELRGRPLIDFVIASVEESDIMTNPVVVVNGVDTSVQDYLGDRAEYIIQKEQLGTGHAVKIGEDSLKSRADQIVVLYGDVPFVTARLINDLVEKQIKDGGVMTIATATVPNYDGENFSFSTLARVERDENGKIIRIIEKKDCDQSQSDIREVNAGYYCFTSEWLWNNLRKLENNNAQREYYLTDLIAIAISNQEKISSITVPPGEAIGINTPEDLDLAQIILTK